MIEAGKKQIKKHKILVVDDESSIREFLNIFLEKEGYDVTLAEDGKRALDLISKNTFDLVITDLQMPKMTGLELMEEVRATDPHLIFFMITAFGTTETAVEAMKLGAYDYIQKPFNVDEIRINLRKALKAKYLERENQQMKRELGQPTSLSGMVGSSRPIMSIRSLVEKLKESLATVLITGESGTGKEVLAKIIHQKSPLREGPFVSVNCGAIPENLIESELFGHKKGSFTGATMDKEGLFEAANGGTLFLDEIGEIPVNIQVKLLRVLQEKMIRRVGGVDDFAVNCRIISATNRNLKEMVNSGEFRQDLYYRINVVQINVPSLRERKDDIPELSIHFLKKHTARMGKDICDLSDEALAHLKKHNYPGNIRELENLVERAVALETGQLLLPESFPSFEGMQLAHQRQGLHNIEVTQEGLDLDEALGEIEKSILLQALDISGGVKKRAAKLLKMTFRSMRYRLAKYNLDTKDDEDIQSLG